MSKTYPLLAPAYPLIVPVPTKKTLTWLPWGRPWAGPRPRSRRWSSAYHAGRIPFVNKNPRKA